MSLPPLVEPGPPLTSLELARYSRHVLVPGVGDEGQRRLRNARVLVVGAGGLGSPVLLYLASAGVGTLGIVDFDVVDLSNLQRQVVHPGSAVGTPDLQVLNGTARQVHGADIAVIVTNGRVTAPAVAFAKQQRLHVVDRHTLAAWASGSRPLWELLRAVPPPRKPTALS